VVTGAINFYFYLGGKTMNKLESILQEIGIEYLDCDGHVKTFREIMDGICELWNTFSDTTKDDIIDAILGSY
jgi:hypothetical protein